MSACMYDRFEPCEHNCKWCKRNEDEKENDNKDFLYEYEKEEKIIDKRAIG